MRMVIDWVRAGAISALALAAPLLQAESVLIRGAKVYTLSAQGTLDSGDILLRDGLVERLAPSLGDIAADRVIDARGKIVTPGFIAPASALGLIEIAAASSTRDNAVAGQSNGAAFDPLPAYNPNSTLIPFNRAGGLTRAVVLPDSTGSVFAGRGFAIKLNGAIDSVVATDLVQKIYLGEYGGQLAGGSRASAYGQVRRALTEAREYAENKAAIQRGDWRALNYPLADLEALQGAISGAQPVLMSANRASDIVRAIELADAFNLRLILLGAAEGWMVADRLAAAQVPVVIDAIDNLPTAFERLGARLDNAAIMQQAGVLVAIRGPGYAGAHNSYLARQAAGNAVAFGLPHEQALKAISANVAKMFALDGGALAPGAVADLVIWNSDPLEVTSFAEQVFIDGQPQSLITRSTRLRDRYLRPQQGYEQAYKRESPKASLGLNSAP